MTVTLIGSRAMKVWFADAREPSDKADWDWQCENYWEGKSDSGPRPWGFPEGTRHDVFRDPRLAQWKSWQAVANPNELYTLKVSHGHWDINGTWSKHAADIVFLQRKGARFLRPLYDILLPIWKEKHAPHKTSLSQDKAGFFADTVKRKYDHDSVHRSVAYYDRPLYESYLADGETVAVDNDKFWALPLDIQLQAVREEVYATALERILIPGNYQGSPGAAYHWALRRTATSLFKNEWALFLLLHLDELRRPDCDYMRRHIQNKSKLIPLGDPRD